MKKYRSFAWSVLLIEIAILAIVMLFFKVDNVRLTNDEFYSFNEKWIIYREDGRVHTDVTLPFSDSSEPNEVFILENKISSTYRGYTLSFMSTDQIFKVYLDNKLIYEFGTKDKRYFGKTPGSGMHYVDIPGWAFDSKIRIEVYSPYKNYGANFSEMVISKRYVAVLDLLYSNLLEFGCILLMVISGAVLGLIGLIRVLSKGDSQGLEFLSWLCMEFAIFYAIETKALTLVFGNMTVLSILAYFCLMTIPIMIQLYFEKTLQGKYEKLAKVLLNVSYVNLVGQIVLQVLNICDFRQMVLLSDAVLVLTLLIALGVSVHIYQQRKDVFVMPTIIAVFILSLTIFSDILRSITVLGGDIAPYSRFGAAVFCVIMLVVHFLKVGRQYAEKAEENARLLEREVEQIEEQNNLLRQAKEEAEVARKEALEANAAKSHFLAHMSHEIRTPINAVLGMDAMILRESKEPKIKEYAKDIQNAGQSLLALINDILDFSKIESGKLEIIPTDYQLSSLLNACYNMIYIRAKEKNLEFQVENNCLIPEHLRGDEIRIRQIIINLLTNAVKYTKEGKITLSVDWESIDSVNLKLKIHVKDTGIGITPENQTKLFQSFKRIDERKNRSIEGTGLGLNITKELVELMKGKISVESEYGKGSVFMVELPQRINSPEPIGDFHAKIKNRLTSEEEYRENFHAPEAKVLVVDDVEMNLKVFVELLRSTRIQVDTAQSGLEAIKKIEEKKYHLIFLDHMMPELDGIQTLHLMYMNPNNKNSDIPVIMLTANAILGARNEYLKEGFSDYLSKPIKEQELEEILLKHLPKELIEKVEVEQEELTTNQITNQTTEKTFLESIDFLDTQIGIGYCADSEVVYQKVLQAYVSSTIYNLAEEAYQAKDWNKYRIQVHALKSTSLNIGATVLSEQAKELEMAARAGDEAYILEHHEDVMLLYNDLLRRLKNILNI